MTNLEQLKMDIMHDIYEHRMILTSIRDRPEGWTLHSGIWSPFYIQLRNLCSFPQTLQLVGKALGILIKEEIPSVNRIVGIAFAGIPIASAVSLESGLPACHTRKILGVQTEQELYDAIGKYGQHSFMEGEVQDGDVLCLVDDLVTGMESKLVGRAQVLAELEKRGVSNVSVDNIVVIIDRQQGAKERAKDANIRLHALIDLVDEGLPMIRDSMSEEEYTLVTKYLHDPSSIKRP
jgi:orotate phosphoribosyltransferase